MELFYQKQAFFSYYRVPSAFSAPVRYHYWRTETRIDILDKRPRLFVRHFHLQRGLPDGTGFIYAFQQFNTAVAQNFFIVYFQPYPAVQCKFLFHAYR